MRVTRTGGVPHEDAGILFHVPVLALEKPQGTNAESWLEPLTSWKARTVLSGEIRAIDKTVV